MKDVFLDTILPGDEGLGLPSASAIAVVLVEWDQYAPVLDQLAIEAGGESFLALDAPSRLALVEKSRRKQARLANGVIVAALKAYYTHPQVLHALGAGAVPPFPDGNFLEDDDWSILEPVFERGPIWREVPA
ncbi:MAG: hypothetical protein AB7G62_10725 [Magnetospirillum sp.]